MFILITLLIGLLGGILSGLLGVGGATLTIPAMVYFLNLDQKVAQGTSLALLMIPVTLFAVINYYKNNLINKNVLLLLVISFPIGAFIGSYIAVKLPSDILKKIFAIFLIIVAIKMLFDK
ncbi:MAG: sulfite exporter TauE/SafE family protein [bacterium]|jgi:uncharacterized membrane protein YfcA